MKIFHVYTGAGVSSVKYRSISPPFHFSRELSPLSLEIKKVYQTISRSSPSRRLAVGRITRTAAPTPARREPPARTMMAPSPASVRRTGVSPPPLNSQLITLIFQSWQILSDPCLHAQTSYSFVYRFLLLASPAQLSTMS